MSGLIGPFYEAVSGLVSIVLCVQLVEELASGRPDTNAVDVAYVEVLGGGPEGRAVDEDAMDNGSDGVCPVPVDDSSHHLVEMRVPVLRPGMLCAFEHEFDYIVN
jgi:hypothetical protein